jgi:hypothetical protein
MPDFFEEELSSEKVRNKIISKTPLKRLEIPKN